MNKQILVQLIVGLIIVFAFVFGYFLITNQDDTQLVSELNTIENQQYNADIEAQALPIDTNVADIGNVKEEIVAKEKSIPKNSQTPNQVPSNSVTNKSVSQNTSLLTVGKVPVGSVFAISQSADVEPKQIPFKITSNLDIAQVSSYQYCISLLKNGVRASETDCIRLEKNLNLNEKIGITDLNLAPYPMTSTYPDGSYLTVGDNQLEIVVALVKNDPSLIYKITGDTSATMDILLDNAVSSGKTGTFTLRVNK